jgi:colanic acid/amylovoran biosynthesis glycosyltransferase
MLLDPRRTYVRLQEAGSDSKVPDRLLPERVSPSGNTRTRDGTAATQVEKPVVAHLNYHFFQSTQSFIWFYLSHLRRVRPICLTRTPESRHLTSELPAALAGDFYLYGGAPRFPRLARAEWFAGVALRGALARLPPRLAKPSLHALQRSVVPRLRPDAKPEQLLDWAAEIVRGRQAQLLHAHYGPVAWRVLALKRRLGLPLVVSFLGDDLGPTVPAWWSWWFQVDGKALDWRARREELFEGADLLLAEGPFARDRLVELGCPPEKVAIQRIALPLDEIVRRPAPPNGRARPVVVFAGRFCEQKGLLYALAAMRRLRESHHDVELRVSGDETMTDGVYAARVYSYVRQHGLEGAVRMLGFLNHDACIEEIRRADVFIAPSIVDDEGIGEGGAPTTILEAQALGVPVVATDHCDIPNVTAPGESALIVPERDPEALADALLELLADPGRREAMGKAGREHVERFHDVEKEARLLEERYFELLGR